MFPSQGFSLVQLSFLSALLWLYVSHCVFSQSALWLDPTWINSELWFIFVCLSILLEFLLYSLFSIVLLTISLRVVLLMLLAFVLNYCCMFSSYFINHSLFKRSFLLELFVLSLLVLCIHSELFFGLYYNHLIAPDFVSACANLYLIVPVLWDFSPRLISVKPSPYFEVNLAFD